MSSSVLDKPRLDKPRTRIRPADWVVVVHGEVPPEPHGSAESITPDRQHHPVATAAAPALVVPAPRPTALGDIVRLLVMVGAFATVAVALFAVLVSQDPLAALPSPFAQPKFVAYERTSPENVRFVLTDGWSQVAAVPGALLLNWRDGQTEPAMRLTMGNPAAEPEIERLSADGNRIEAIRYRSAWPGVDVVITATSSGWSSNAIVAPGVDPSIIEMEYVGATSLTLDASGRLHIQGQGGEWIDGVPESWQDGPTGRTPVDSSFVLSGGGRFGFNVGGYDPSSPLVIDPPSEPSL